MVFSKFRSFSYKGDINDNSDFVCSLYSDDNKYLRDILKNNRLYASNFLKFNDVREGWFNFLFSKSDGEKDIVKALENIRSEKEKRFICCFSKKFRKDSKKELLMWAHYANNHIGFRIDFILDENEMSKTYDVKYGYKPKLIENIENYSPENSEIIEILTRKDKVWKYEREYRTILDPHDTSNDVDDKNGEFVNINIERVVIGRGFLPVIFDYDRSKSIPRNIEDLSYALRELLKNEKIKISIYKSRYDDELIDIEDTSKK
jgi:hypothetical protein|nr:DUF2971 domain-containing protein [uncultured Campylobacter sp.]